MAAKIVKTIDEATKVDNPTKGIREIGNTYTRTDDNQAGEDVGEKTKVGTDVKNVINQTNNKGNQSGDEDGEKVVIERQKN